MAFKDIVAVQQSGMRAMATNGVKPILRFGIRLLLLAVLLYIALRFFSAPAGAILVGLVTGTILGLVNFTYYMRKGA